MKKIFFLFALSVTSSVIFGQYVYKLKADSVLITNDSCSAELIIENSTKNIKGFLYNYGNGRTRFQKGLIKVNDSTYIIGADTLKISAASGAGWLLSGNSGINPALNFLGTLDNRSLRIRTDNIERLIVDSNGKVGIGISAPAYPLQVDAKTGTGIAINSKFGADSTQVPQFIIRDSSGGGAFEIKSMWYSYPGLLWQPSFYIGDSSGFKFGVANIGIGSHVMQKANNSHWNIAIGSFAMQNITSSNQFNVAIGYKNLMDLAPGYISNTVVGHNAAPVFTTGSWNSAFGNQAMINLVSGQDNLALGQSSMYGITSGSFNVFVGNKGGGSLRTSTGVTAIGHNAAAFSGGTYNTFIGFNSGKLDTVGNYNVILGSNDGITLVGKSKWVYISDGFGNIKIAMDSVGNTGIGVNTPLAKLHVNGSARFDLGSDATGDIYYRNSAGLVTKLSIGSAGQVLTVSGGLPAWLPASGGGGTPGGSNGHVQFNNSGAFGGSTNLFWDNTNFRLGVGTATPQSRLHVSGTTRLDLGSDASGDMLYRSSGGDLTRLPVGTANQALAINSSSQPAWINVSRLLGKRTTATAAIGNTETQVLGVTIPANTLAVGDVLRLTAYGIQTNTATASTSIYRFRIGTTTLTGNIPASSSWVNGTTAKTNIIVQVTADILITAIGASGTAIGQINANKGFVSATTPVGVTAAVTVNTTVANIAEFTFISGAASTTNTFHTATIQIIKN